MLTPRKENLVSYTKFDLQPFSSQKGMSLHKRKSSHDVNGNKKRKTSKHEDDVNPLLALLEANQAASLLDNDLTDNEDDLEAQRE